MNRQMIEKILVHTEVLMTETEKERDEKLLSCASDAAEAETAEYKRFLTSIYRMRNNAAALLLRSNCGCEEEYDQLILHGEKKDYSLNKKAMKNILQKEYDEILLKNKEKTANQLNLLVPAAASASIKKPADSIPLTKVNLNVKPETSVNKQKDLDEAASEKVNLNRNDHGQVNNELVCDRKKDTPTNGFGFFLHKETEVREEKEENKKEEIIAEAEAKADPAITSGFFLNSKKASTSPNEEIKKQACEAIPAEEKVKKLSGFTSFFKSRKEPENGEEKEEPILQEKEPVQTETFFTETEREERPSTADETEKKERMFMTEAAAAETSPALFRADLSKLQEIEGESAHEEMEKVEVTETFYDLHEEKPVKKEEKRNFWFSKKKEEKQKAKDYDLGVVTHNDTNPKQSVFKLNSLEPQKEEPVEETEKPKPAAFSSAAVDTEELIQKLRMKRDEYDKKVIAKKVENANRAVPTSGMVFNLSTGAMKNGMASGNETNKIETIAKETIKTEIRDRILEETAAKSTARVYTYEMQKETDRNRKKEEMVFDEYQMKVQIKDDAGNLLKTEEASFIVAPMSIPKSGFNLVTDICVYFSNQYESHGAVVQPDGKTTLLIKCDEYAIFIRGSWDQGKFISAVSVKGIGCQADAEFEKKSFAPASMEGVGIGHNILYLDHATTVHIIPLSCSNNQYGRASFMAVVEKDYGIDKDTFCVLQEHGAADILIKGERYRFSLSGVWEEETLSMNVTIAR